MTEYLFKLKKDGKTVGYLKIADGWTQFQHLGRDDWYFPCDFNWNSAHPFVTKDKNKKNVFADDCIGAKNKEMDNKPYRQGIVKMEDYSWGISIQNTIWEPLFELEDIELIEEENE